MYNYMSLDLPDGKGQLCTGFRIKIGRFDSRIWEVKYGWYSWGENRPVCGWYLVDTLDPSFLKPLQLNDLDDLIYVQM